MILQDKKKIDDLLTRGVSQILPSRELLEKELRSGRRLRVYMGADATGPRLHIGHATNLLILERFRKLGHEVIVLFGDFTAMIGDPSGREIERTPLSQDAIEKNLAGWKAQAAKIVSFDDQKNPALIKRNSEWLSRLTFSDLIPLASEFTTQQMMERDMFARRVKAQKPIHLNEFLYPIMQGYDSVAMDVDIEIGGTDQTFNMMTGRVLQKRFHQKEKFVMTTTLLEHPKTGKKLMSKSEGHFIALDDRPDEMFGKAMALPDEIMMQVYTDCTTEPLEKIELVGERLQGGENPRDIKLDLAEALTRTYHGEQSARAAREHFVATFQKKEAPAEVMEVSGADLASALASAGVLASKGEFRRLEAQGAIHDLGDGKFRIGSHRFVHYVRA